MTAKNNIPAGYKDSAVGIIPQEWEVATLGKLVSITSGESPSLFNLRDIGKYPYIKVEDMNNCEKYQADSREYTDDERVVIAKGSIIFPKRGAAITNNKVRIAACQLYMDSNMMAITPNDLVCGDYLYFKITYEQLFKIADTSTIPQINNKHIIPYKICLPPMEEQRKIAEILGVWDEAIEKQSRLIEKLELRKRALMQHLLTGRTRLPGFTTPWQKVKLGEIGKISSAGVDKKVNEGEVPVRLLNFVDVFYRDFIYNDELTHWVTAKPIKVEQCSVQKGDIFFTPSSEMPTDIAISAVAMEDMKGVVYSYHIVRLRPHIEMDLHYRAYAFKTDEFYKQAERICDGSGQRYVISQDGFRNMSIHLPSLPEQKAIAEVLTTADKEIASHRKKLDALRLQKRGLMQQLLTGKTRVKI
ncbi:MAG: restriction endonuclease subunit S [Alistipes sp.]|nr:restriction endonuclease subunit S [Alistipes sp.]